MTLPQAPFHSIYQLKHVNNLPATGKLDSLE